MKQRNPLVHTLKLFVAVLGLTLCMACGDKKETNPDLIQAFELHKESMTIRKATKEQLAQLKANTDSLFMATHAKEVEALTSSLEAWDDQLIEVPGFEEEHDHADHDHSHDNDHSGHDHDHDHDHDHHHHGEAPKLTPKQHLEVQQHLLGEIKAIAEKINNLK